MKNKEGGYSTHVGCRAPLRSAVSLRARRSRANLRLTIFFCKLSVHNRKNYYTDLSPFHCLPPSPTLCDKCAKRGRRKIEKEKGWAPKGARQVQWWTSRHSIHRHRLARSKIERNCTHRPYSVFHPLTRLVCSVPFFPPYFELLSIYYTHADQYYRKD